MELVIGQILQGVDSVARDKGIDREDVFVGVEQAIQKAARSKYGYDKEIRVVVDRDNAKVRVFHVTEIVELVENPATQITVAAAQKIDPSYKAGDFIMDELPMPEFGRMAAQTAKQVIVHKVRDAERDRQFKEYKDKIGEITFGIVKRLEFGNMIVDLGRAEAIIRRDEMLPRETFRQGDRVRAYIYDVRKETKGPQIFLSRTHPQFMAKLFAQEVPEIYEGVIEIKAVARDPGSRAKIAVFSRDNNIDPVGACVGMRGSRVQAVVGELQGEKVDIVPWSADQATFVVNALAPAEVAKVVLDEDNKRIEVVVPDAQLSLAIGRRGQNVRLGSILTGWDIDILSEAEESERRAEEYKTRSKLFIEALDIDDVIAALLIGEGYASVEDIAEVPLENLSSIEGFSEEVAGELKQRAANFIEAANQKIEAELTSLDISAELRAIEGLSGAMLVALGKAGVKTLDDLGDLATDELQDHLKPFAPSKEQAEAWIMAARAHWFTDEAKA
jgi:N utilization substance protein A